MTIQIKADLAGQTAGVLISIPPVTPPLANFVNDTVPAVPTQSVFTVESKKVLVSADVSKYMAGLTLNYLTTSFNTTPGTLLGTGVGTAYAVSGLATKNTAVSNPTVIKTTTFTFTLIVGLPASGPGGSPVDVAGNTYGFDVTITVSGQSGVAKSV